MDARSFASFLTDKLTDAAKAVEENILRCAYKEMDQLHRAAGTRDVLKEITSKMEHMLSDFFGRSDSGSSSDSGE